MLKIRVKYNVCLTNHVRLPLHAERYDTVYIDTPSFTTSEIERIISQRDPAMQGGAVSILSVDKVMSQQGYSGVVHKTIPERMQYNDAKCGLVREAKRKMEFRLGMMGFELTVDQCVPLQAVWIALENTMRNMNFNSYIGKE